MDRKLIIDSVEISDLSDCYVIAEIGHNHQGDLEKCKELFRSAKLAGANAVKLQKRDNRSLFTREMYESPYNSENAFGDTYGSHREFLEFGREEYEELQIYSRELGVTFFATPFDISSANFLKELHMPAYKIASGDLTNTPLIRHVARFGKPIIISTGGAEMADVVRAYKTAKEYNDQIALLQCTAGYPPDWNEINLRVIETYREVFQDAVIGLSTHDSGIAIGLVGYVLGARILEKHFTLNRASKGTDHAFSLEKPGLQKIIRDLRRARATLGDGVKVRYSSEEAPMYKMGKKLVASRDLKSGHVLTEKDLLCKSPSDGLPPYEYVNLIGRTLRHDLKENGNISFSDLAEG